MGKKKPTSKKPVKYSPTSDSIPKIQLGNLSNASTIKSEKDLVNFLGNIDDIKYLESNPLKLDETILKLKLEGDNFESSLPGSLIIGLAKYQEKIYTTFLTSKYGVGTKRKITSEEAKLLEIKVTVKQGSTEVWIKLLIDKAWEVIGNMPTDQISSTLITIAMIAAVAYCLKGLGSLAVKQALKTKRRALAEKKSLSKDEVEKKKLEILESSVNAAIEGMKMVSLGIVQAEPSRIAINDKIVSTSDIKSAIDGLEPEKPELKEEHSVISGTYRIQRVTFDFKRDSASADIFDVESGDPIHGLVMQPKHLSDGSYRVLKTAQDKQDVKLQIIITKRNDNIYKAVLDKILDN
jgi:hypothetical protein